MFGAWTSATSPHLLCCQGSDVLNFTAQFELSHCFTFQTVRKTVCTLDFRQVLSQLQM